MQLGDQIDRARKVKEFQYKSDYDVAGRYPELEVLVYIEMLQQQARASGGDLYALLGNHEMYSTRLTPDINGWYDSYVSTSDMRAYDLNNGQTLNLNRHEKFRAGTGVFATKLFANQGLLLKIGDVIFSHADVGTIKEYKDGGVNLKNLNALAHTFLTTGEATADVLTQIGVRDKKSNGPVWNRTLCELVGYDCSKDLINPNLYFVAAHTIQIGMIQGKCNNHVWCIDTGRSAAFTEDVRNIHQQSLQIDLETGKAPTFTVLGAANFEQPTIKEDIQRQIKEAVRQSEARFQAQAQAQYNEKIRHRRIVDDDDEEAQPEHKQPITLTNRILQDAINILKTTNYTFVRQPTTSITKQLVKDKYYSLCGENNLQIEDILIEVIGQSAFWVDLFYDTVLSGFIKFHQVKGNDLFHKVRNPKKYALFTKATHSYNNKNTLIHTYNDTDKVVDLMFQTIMDVQRTPDTVMSILYIDTICGWGGYGNLLYTLIITVAKKCNCLFVILNALNEKPYLRANFKFLTTGGKRGPPYDKDMYMIVSVDDLEKHVKTRTNVLQPQPQRMSERDVITAVTKMNARVQQTIGKMQSTEYKNEIDNVVFLAGAIPFGVCSRDLRDVVVNTCLMPLMKKLPVADYDWDRWIPVPILFFAKLYLASMWLQFEPGISRSRSVLQQHPEWLDDYGITITKKGIDAGDRYEYDQMTPEFCNNHVLSLLLDDASLGLPRGRVHSVADSFALYLMVVEATWDDINQHLAFITRPSVGKRRKQVRKRLRQQLAKDGDNVVTKEDTAKVYFITHFVFVANAYGPADLGRVNFSLQVRWHVFRVLCRWFNDILENEAIQANAEIFYEINYALMYLVDNPTVDVGVKISDLPREVEPLFFQNLALAAAPANDVSNASAPNTNVFVPSVIVGDRFTVDYHVHDIMAFYFSEGYRLFLAPTRPPSRSCGFT